MKIGDIFKIDSKFATPTAIWSSDAYPIKIISINDDVVKFIQPEFRDDIYTSDVSTIKANCTKIEKYISTASRKI